MLWTGLKKDDFETNVADVLKEMSSIAKERLKNYCLNEKHWLIACDASRKRASMLAKYSCSCTYSYFIHYLDQEKLYFYQKQNYIKTNHMLCI